MSKGTAVFSERELNLFTPDYQEEVKKELKRGNDFAYSFNDVQFRRIREMAKEIAEKKTKKKRTRFAAIFVDFERGEILEENIVGWKVVPYNEIPPKAVVVQ